MGTADLRRVPPSSAVASRPGSPPDGYWVAVRARSRVPAVVPMYMSRVMRMLACPARRETSAGSMFQVNRAVVQNTCRRLCQVQMPVAVGVAPSGGQVGRGQDAAGEVGRPPVGASGGGEDQAQGVGPGGLLSAGLPEAGRDLLGEGVAGGGGAGVDGAPPFAALGQLDVELPADLDDLAVHGHDAGVLVDLVCGQGGQLAPPQPGIGGEAGHQLIGLP